MARLVETKHHIPDTRRFKIINTNPHQQTIYLLDRFTQLEFTVETAGNREFYTMQALDDTRWMQWLDNVGAYK